MKRFGIDFSIASAEVKLIATNAGLSWDEDYSGQPIYVIVRLAIVDQDKRVLNLCESVISARYGARAWRRLLAKERKFIQNMPRYIPPAFRRSRGPLSDLPSSHAQRRLEAAQGQK